MAGKPKEKKDNDWISWALIIFLFIIGLSPIALILLFLKLFASDGKKKQVSGAAESAWEQVEEANPSRAKSAVKKVTKSPVPKKSNAKWLKIVGAVVAAAGIVAAAEPLGMIPYSYDWIGVWLEDFLAALAIAVGGGAMFFSGISMDRQLKRYTKYLAVMGDREAMPVDDLARTLGYSKRQVERDLQKMIDKGYFGGKAYLNMQLGYLFRSGEADAAWRKQREEQSSPKEAEEGYAGLLQKIRQANDRIADPVLSAKIDRIEEITARIFRAVEADPKKQDRIQTFLNYYLPTTQKLLDSYAEFESAGVEGENLRQAKQRIETTIDKIVSGFEHQLDELYKEDALDVDSDIRVMETMLKRDTGSVEQDFGVSSIGE